MVLSSPLPPNEEFINPKTGDNECMMRLGQMYESALGVPRDCGKAAAWYKIAEKSGNITANELWEAICAPMRGSEGEQ